MSLDTQFKLDAQRQIGSLLNKRHTGVSGSYMLSLTTESGGLTISESSNGSFDPNDVKQARDDSDNEQKHELFNFRAET